jgi:hypothetical protein
VLVRSQDGLADALRVEPGWALAHEDPTAVVFVRS